MTNLTGADLESAKEGKPSIVLIELEAQALEATLYLISYYTKIPCNEDYN